MELDAGAQLHPLVSGFDDAETYARGRPPYGEPVAWMLCEQLGLSEGDPALELGPGTGQLSLPLLAAGLDLVAVEPLGPTRELLCRSIGRERVREGRAEAIPLPDSSVAAVFAADSFHWFDERRAMGEIKRVLRERGGVAILRTIPMFDAPWAHELGTLLADARPQHPAFAGRGAAAALEDDPAFGPVTDSRCTTPARFDRERLIAYVASISWVGSLPGPRREELLGRLGELLDRHGVQPGEHELLHRIWVARLT